MGNTQQDDEELPGFLAFMENARKVALGALALIGLGGFVIAVFSLERAS